MATIFEMQPKLKILNLLLDGIGAGTDIDSLDDRKKVQKSVYLAQRTGADLGYRYGWYLLGPYSPALTKDYYDLANARRIGEGTNGSALSAEIREKLSRLRPYLRPPSGVNLSEESWLELLASVDYLRKVMNYNDERLDKVISEQKPGLQEYLAAAKQQLRQMPLLG